jgi:FAD-dependent urate hydroxylase
LALEDTSLLALMLTRSESTPQQVFAEFEGLRRQRVEAIVEAGRRQKSNKVAVSTVGMWVRNFFISVFFNLIGMERFLGKAWRYRIDWEERDVKKVVKWYKGGKLVNSY